MLRTAFAFRRRDVEREQTTILRRLRNVGGDRRFVSMLVPKCRALPNSVGPTRQRADTRDEPINTFCTRQSIG